MKKHLLFTLSLVALFLCLSSALNAQTPITSLDDLTDGYYQIVYQGQAYTTNSQVEDPEDALGTYLTNYTEEFSAASNNRYYPIGLSAPIEGQIGRTFLRVNGSAETAGKYNIQAQNGHYLDLVAKASINPVDLTIGERVVGETVAGLYVLGYLAFAENCWASTKENGEFTYILGKSGNNQQLLEFYPAPL